MRPRPEAIPEILKDHPTLVTGVEIPEIPETLGTTARTLAATIGIPVTTAEILATAVGTPAKIEDTITGAFPVSAEPRAVEGKMTLSGMVP